MSNLINFKDLILPNFERNTEKPCGIASLGGESLPDFG